MPVKEKSIDGDHSLSQVLDTLPEGKKVRFLAQDAQGKLLPLVGVHIPGTARVTSVTELADNPDTIEIIIDATMVSPEDKGTWLQRVIDAAKAAERIARN